MGEYLKPCPFCGGIKITGRDHDNGTPTVWMVCEDCGAHGPPDDWRGNAVARWNTRSEGLQPPVVEVDGKVFSSLGASKAPSCGSPTAPETPSGGWQDIAERRPPEAPGNYVNVRSVLTYRYLAYKPDGARQMKKPGRWQRATEHGWENADLPVDGEWTPNYPVPPSRQTSGGEA